MVDREVTMDNVEQVKEIIWYYNRLYSDNHEISLDEVAEMWIRKYARAWRKLHNKN